MIENFSNGKLEILVRNFAKAGKNFLSPKFFNMSKALNWLKKLQTARNFP